MGDKTSKVALGLSVLSIVASAGIAIGSFYGQTLLTGSVQQADLAVAGAQTAVSAGQLCLSWATFVSAERRAGLTDGQIDRKGQLIFGTSDALLVAVVQTLHGDFTNPNSKTTPRDIQAEYGAFVKDVRKAAPANSIVVPDLSSGFSILSLCGSAHTFRAVVADKRPVVPLGQLSIQP